MFISLRSISTAWIVGASSGSTGIGGYLIYDSVNPTGNQWLLNSGYIFNRPQFTSHKSEGYGCAENLFKDNSNFEDNKLYSCKVSGLTIWNSGDQFKDQKTDVDYLGFSEEWVLKRGDKGWKILIRVSNHNGLFFQRTWFSFVKDNKGWRQDKKINESLSAILRKSSEPYYENPEKQLLARAKQISSNNELLDFSFYGEEWYKGMSASNTELTSVNNQESSIQEPASENYKAVKSGSWIWAEDMKGGLASKSTSMWNTSTAGLYQSKGKPTVNTDSISEDSDLNEQLKKFKLNPWSNTEEICKHGSRRNISKEQKRNLRLFCSKSNTPQT